MKNGGRKFGILLSVITFVSSYWLHDDLKPLYAFALYSLAVSALALAILKPLWLVPAHSIWMIFGKKLGIVMNPLALGLIFFLVLTPVGLLQRLCGRDELGLKLDKSISFWTSKIDQINKERTFERQF